MELPFFPVSWKDLPGTIKIRELKKMEFSVGKVRVHSTIPESSRHLRRLPALHQGRLDCVPAGQ